MYQKPYTCTEINVLLHLPDLRALILRYNNVRGPTFPGNHPHYTAVVDYVFTYWTIFGKYT